MRRLLLLLVLVLGLSATGAEAQPRPDARLDHERIQDYRVRLEIDAQARLGVTETIRVVALGREIRRGIFRVLPLARGNWLGRSVPAFEILRVTRDGRPEPYHTESRKDGIRIYIGDSDVLLQPGIYTYELVYRAARQIDFHDAFDELYWNVTGNDWSFLIEQAEATVVLPPGAEPEAAAAYTGPEGSREQAAVIHREASGATVLATTRVLAPGEGLTVAVGWPKGFVDYPSRSERLWHALVDSRAGLLALLVLGLVLAYYLLVWHRVGRDPKGGPVVAVYDPKLPPAAMRFIRRMRYDGRCFAAALVSLAVKGRVVLEDGDKGDELVVLRGGPEGEAMSDGEAKLFQALFANGERVRIAEAERTRLLAATQSLKSHFERTFNREYFRRNRGYFIVGAVATVLGWLAIAGLGPDPETGAFLSVWLAGWTVGTAVVVVRALDGLRRGFGGGGGLAARFEGLVGSLMAVPFVGGWIFGAVALAAMVGAVATVFLAVAALLNLVFFNLLKAPTSMGRAALDEIEGVALYLGVAEKDRFAFHHGQPETPEMIERLLPYAIALDLETVWTERLNETLARAKRTPETHRPSWYRGSRFQAARFGRLPSSLASAVQTATAPRSSGGGSSGGGSRGGGSSGGGRGGGGGGGW